MNGYTILGLAIDFAIIFYLYKLVGEQIVKDRYATEIIISASSIILILSTTFFSSIDTVTLVVSTITASAIGLGNYLILKDAIDNDKHIHIPFLPKKFN